jgi:protein required for attachment to host cells
MDQRERAEKWADSVLDSHRSAPKGSVSIEDDIFAEQIRRNLERQAMFAKIDAIVWIVGAVLACAFALAWLSMF